MNDKQNVSQAIEALERHQLRKLLARAKADEELSRADMQMLERLKATVGTTPSDAELPAKKTPRGRPKESRRIVEEIERQALEQLRVRQQRGEKLTGADYSFLEKVKQANLEKASTAKKRELPSKSPLPERLKASKEVAFETLCTVTEHSKSHLARVTAAQALKKWADEEVPPDESFEVCAYTPEELARGGEFRE